MSSAENGIVVRPVVADLAQLGSKGLLDPRQGVPEDPPLLGEHLEQQPRVSRGDSSLRAFPCFAASRAASNATQSLPDPACGAHVPVDEGSQSLAQQHRASVRPVPCWSLPLGDVLLDLVDVLWLVVELLRCLAAVLRCGFADHPLAHRCFDQLDQRRRAVGEEGVEVRLAEGRGVYCVLADDRVQIAR